MVVDGLVLILDINFIACAEWDLCLAVILLLIGAGYLANSLALPEQSARKIWEQVHGGFLLLGYVVIAFGFIVGVMYFLQAQRLKHKKTASTLKLPALEWLERANHRATIWAALFVGIGVFTGILLKLIRPGSVPWTDPVVWRTGAMWLWLVVAAIFAAMYRPAQRGRKVAYLTIASFLFLLASVGVGVYPEYCAQRRLATQHDVA